MASIAGARANYLLDGGVSPASAVDWRIGARPRPGDLRADQALVVRQGERGEEAVQIDYALAGQEALAVAYLRRRQGGRVGEVNVEDAVPQRGDFARASA
jgi:hypothetical protein